MSPEEKFLNKNTFHCKILDTRISKKQCNINQHKRDKEKHIFGDTIDMCIEKCRSCKTGKKYYKKSDDNRIAREKECLMHKLSHKKCTGSGIVVDLKLKKGV